MKQRPSKVKAFGNLDTEQKYPITQDAIDAERYVLLHYSHIKETDPNNPQKPLDTGIIDTRTFTYGIYTPSTYDEYVREDEKTGKVNTFNKIKDKYIVLHDPTLESDDDNSGDDDLMSHTKAELLEMLNGTEATDEELKIAALPATNKAKIIELITKYKQA